MRILPAVGLISLPVASSWRSCSVHLRHGTLIHPFEDVAHSIFVGMQTLYFWFPAHTDRWSRSLKTSVTNYCKSNNSSRSEKTVHFLPWLNCLISIMITCFCQTLLLLLILLGSYSLHGLNSFVYQRWFHFRYINLRQYLCPVLLTLTTVAQCDVQNGKPAYLRFGLRDVSSALSHCCRDCAGINIQTPAIRLSEFLKFYALIKEMPSAYQETYSW